MIRQHDELLRARELRRTGIYLIREGEEIGPYTLERAKSLLKEGSMGPNDLVKIGSDGRLFPAAALVPSS